MADKDDQAPPPDEGQTPPSPLGQDPEPSNTPPKEDNPPPKDPPKEETSKKELTEEEYNALLEKANVYDLINGDPEISSTVNNYFRTKGGKTPPDDDKDSQNKDDKGLTREELDRILAERDAEHKRELARLQVESFRSKHPDMDEYKQDMHTLISQYGMPLEEAYEFAKSRATAQKGENKSVQQAEPPKSTAENVGGGNFDDNEGDPLAAARRRIEDPKATKSMSDAVEQAWKAALQAEQSKE